MELVIKKDVPSKPTKPNQVFWRQQHFFLGTQSRIATLTDVKFVDENTMVVAHRAAAELYLIKIHHQAKLNIIDTLVLHKEPEKYNTFHPDLMSIHNETLYLTCYRSKICIVKIVNGTSLSYQRTIIINKQNIPYHGIFYHKEIIYLGGCNSTHKNTLFSKYNTKTQKIQHITNKHLNGYRMKSICYYDNNKLIIGLDTGGDVSKNSLIKIFEIKESSSSSDDDVNLVQLGSIEIHQAQTDGSCIYKNYYFTTMHYIDSQKCYILVYKIENNNTLTLIKKKECHDFAHGIDIFDDKLAYTSYAQSCVIITSLKDFISD